MKVSKIEKKDGIYHVTKTPNLIERILGKVEVVERYRKSGRVFTHFNHIKVFYKSDGSVVSWNDEMCTLLNNYDRAF